MNYLAKQTQNSVQVSDLKTVADKLHAFVNNENEEALRTVTEAINESPGILERFFPSPLKREKNRLAQEQMRKIYKNKEEFLELYSNVKLEIARIETDTLVQAVGMDAKEKLAAFAANCYQKLAGTIHQSRISYMRSWASHQEEMKEFENIPELFELGKISMSSELKNYFNTVDELLNAFYQALVKKASETRAPKSNSSLLFS